MENLTFANNKAYNGLDGYFKKIFGKKVIKIALDIGATCPNLDGTKSTKGCTFCSGGSGDFSTSGQDIIEQLNRGKELVSKKWKDGLYMPYFQSYTNTYLPVNYLKERVDRLLLEKDVVGISISTRPDCISDEMLCYLEKLSRRTFLIVELGLQSAKDDTLKRINRGHTVKDFDDCYKRLKGKGIKVCVHIVDGLIGETKEDMLNTAKYLASIKPDFVKIHLLYFVNGTIDTLRYQNGEIKPLLKQEYIDILVSQIERLPQSVVIERLTGDGDKSKLIAPKYSTDKRGMLSAIDNAFRDRNTYQGRLYVENK